MWVTKKKHEAEIRRLRAEKTVEVCRRMGLENAIMVLYPAAPTRTGGRGRSWLDTDALIQCAEAVRRARRAKADALVLEEVEGG